MRAAPECHRRAALLETEARPARDGIARPVYIDTSEIREGKLEALKMAITQLVVEANEPRTIAYHVYIKAK